LARKKTRRGAGSGLSSPALFEKFGRLGALLRTYLLCECEAATGLQMTWKQWHTSGKRLWWALGRSEPRTNVTGCGLSPEKPRNEDSEQTGAHRGEPDTLTSAARTNWRTPHGMDNEGNPRRNGPTGNELGNQVMQSQTLTNGTPQPSPTEEQDASGKNSTAPDWQTPSATCADAGATSRSGDRKDELLLGGQVRQESIATPAICSDGNSPPKEGSQPSDTTASVMWPTPRSSESENRTTQNAPSHKAGTHGKTLAGEAAENWQTATARDFRSPCASEATHEKNSRPLSEVVGLQDLENPNTPGKPRGSLNSAWVMQLIGFPDEYAAELTRLLLEFAATPGAIPSRK